MLLYSSYKYFVFLISNFRRVLNIVCILLGISPASDCGFADVSEPSISSIFKGWM